MGTQLGAGFRPPSLGLDRPVDESRHDVLLDALAALAAQMSSLAEMVAGAERSVHVPAPVVTVVPPDLSELVELLDRPSPALPEPIVYPDLSGLVERLESVAQTDAGVAVVLREMKEQLVRLNKKVSASATAGGGGGGTLRLAEGHGLLTEAVWQGRTPDLTGTWDYRSGTSGTPDLPADCRVLGIAAVAGASAASFTINGGDSIPVPASRSASATPGGNLVDPTIVFTGTVGYLVDFLV